MELKSTEALRVFREKGVEWLRHANTVRTVCTFFRSGRLLARGVIHEAGLDQTAQQSDRKDRALGVWYDLFFDASDMHELLNQRNIYGPVLLEFDLSLLEQDWLPFVWVTKTNPIHWDVDTPSNERWFTSIEELEAGYDPRDPGHHIVLRNVAGTVRLKPYLRTIIVDYTQRFPYGSAQTNYSKMAVASFLAAAKEGKVGASSIKLKYRDHSATACQCTAQYQSPNMRLAVVREFFVDENSPI
ncbi:hypothetical protein [Hymenobacter psoromatis]|uniref:hypothetical protein n=1 Tax=Hymenobacter psoromatis TaxID=1484116 RepID=UPI001CBF8666|nr:hypothetical protein [Hymenobacter psoromatis]